MLRFATSQGTTTASGAKVQPADQVGGDQLSKCSMFNGCYPQIISQFSMNMEMFFLPKVALPMPTVPWTDRCVGRASWSVVVEVTDSQKFSQNLFGISS